MHCFRIASGSHLRDFNGKDMDPQRILFMGTPHFAVASLDALVKAGFDVAAVVTAPDKPAGRGRQLRASAVKERALELGLPVLQPTKLRDPQFLDDLDRIGASLFVVVAFRMLPEMVWSKPPLGTVNLHASLLPDYRGAAPINWAIINGERSTGATTFFIQQQVDTGDLIAQAPVEIGKDMTAGELHDRLMAVGADLLTRTVRDILSGSAQRVPQVHRSDVRLRTAPKLDPENCRIDWRRTSSNVHDHIRGLSPFPGAHAMLAASGRDAMHFKVLRARVLDTEGSIGEPGTVTFTKDGMAVHCGNGMVELLEVQPEGKRRMTAAEFLNGSRALGPFRFV